MKRLPVLTCLCIVLGAWPTTLCAQGNLEQRIDELGRQITAKISAKQETTIALVEFADLQGHVTNFGRFLAEELITRLHETDKFKTHSAELSSSGSFLTKSLTNKS